MADETPEVLRNRAEEIVSGSQFEPGPIDRAVEWVGDQLGTLFGEFFTRSSFGGVAIGWIILAAMVILIAYFLIRFRPRLSVVGPVGAEVQTRTRRIARSRKEWLAQAKAAEAEGRHRDAVEARYRATVAGLVEADEVTDSPGATVNEVRSQFDAAAARTDPFSNATDVFSDMQYGGAEVGPEDPGRLRELDGAVMGSGGRRGTAK